MKVLCPTATTEEMMFLISNNKTWIPTQSMEWIWTVSEGQRIEFRSLTGYVECKELNEPLYTYYAPHAVGEDK